MSQHPYEFSAHVSGGQAPASSATDMIPGFQQPGPFFDQIRMTISNAGVPQQITALALPTSIGRLVVAGVGAVAADRLAKKRKDKGFKRAAWIAGGFLMPALVVGLGVINTLKK